MSTVHFLDLIAGKLTRLLVGARNNGTNDFLVESIDGSLRYPQDFTYHIQNFTLLRPEAVIESGSESTFEYMFMPSETFVGRPMGLVVLLNYRTKVRVSNSMKSNTVRLCLLGRQTLSERRVQSNHQLHRYRRRIRWRNVRRDSSVICDHLMPVHCRFFLYLFLGAILALSGYLAYQYLLSSQVRRIGGKSASQNGFGAQQGKGNYDVDWIPKHHLAQSTRLSRDRLIAIAALRRFRSFAKEGRARPQNPAKH